MEALVLQLLDKTVLQTEITFICTSVNIKSFVNNGFMVCELIIVGTCTTLSEYTLNDSYLWECVHQLTLN